MQVVRRAWLPLLIVFVVLIAGFTVDRIRGFFASEGPLVTPVNFA
ncbi:MAG: rane protein, partial [Mycobacterium sp.]|nr:rane protein [Mycobacterium sp.]